MGCGYFHQAEFLGRIYMYRQVSQDAALQELEGEDIQSDLNVRQTHHHDIAW